MQGKRRVDSFRKFDRNVEDKLKTFSWLTGCPGFGETGIEGKN
jgi:hypothetical protein